MMKLTEKLSRAAEERAAAQKVLRSGGFAERETYTAKQMAARCGTDAKTMRKFFRSTYSTVEPVGQGGRYEFDKADLPKVQEEFAKWLNRASVTKRQVSTPKQSARSKPKVEARGVITTDAKTGEVLSVEIDFDPEEEPTDEELAELEVVEDLDLTDLED